MDIRRRSEAIPRDRDRDRDRERCLAAGMDDYVGKPVRTAQLEDVLGRALNLNPADGGYPSRMAHATDENGDQLEAVVDRSPLADAYGEDEHGRAEVVALFLHRSREAIDELAAALDQSDAGAAARVAHALKGSAAAVGAGRLCAVATELQGLLAAGRMADAIGLQSVLERTLQLTDATFNGPTETVMR